LGVRNVNTSVDDAAVGVYAEPLVCFTLDGNVTVLPLTVVNIKLIVCPPFMFVGLICVEPVGNVNVKKLPVAKFSDAVDEAIVKGVILPRIEPVIIVGPVTMFTVPNNVWVSLAASPNWFEPEE